MQFVFVIQILNINSQTMKNQLNMSHDEKNQFISQQNSSYTQPNNQLNQNQELQKMFFMFQKMATDPSMFMKMMSSVRPPEPEVEQRKRQFQVEQHKYRNHQISPRRKDLSSSPVSKQQQRYKPKEVVKRYSVNENANVLQKYFPSSNQSAQNLAESTVTVSSREQHLQKFQDRPIQTSYTNNVMKQKNPSKKIQISQQIPISKNNPDDQRPIKPAKGFTSEGQLNQSVLANNSMAQPINPSKYIEAQQRPIKGIQGDFKNYVMKQGGFPASQYANQNQNEEDEEQQNSQVPKARTFLKRGSRQHLSSAIDRSVQKPKINKGIAKEQLDLSSSNVKQNQKQKDRSISQNRLLGRKSISAKSISKKQPTKSLKEDEQKQKKPMQYSSTGSNYTSANNQGNKNTEGNRTPRIMQKNQIGKNKNKNNHRQDSSSPTFQVEAPVQKKSKKKNIFQQSSSEQEAEQKTVKALQNNKNQVIPGVYLSKKQLHQIITKYSKAGPPTASSSQSQIQQLKAKYIDLCNILAQQKQIFEIQMQKEKEDFESYKNGQLAKIKNERKVQERNLINNQKNKEKEKEREELQTLRKMYDKEKDQFKHKQKNYKIMIQKYKKLAEQRQKLPSQEQKPTIQKKDEEIGSVGIKKKSKQISSSNQDYNSTQNDEINPNSRYKGAEENVGYHINRKDTPNTNTFTNKQAISTQKQKQKLPNYQDLKKPSSGNPSKTNVQISNQNGQKNKKYEYYQQTDNKQTSKVHKKYNDYFESQQQQKDLSPEKDGQSDTQQIVEYNPSMKLSDLAKIPLTIKMVTQDMIQNLFRYQNNPEYKKYLQTTKSKIRNKIHTNRNAAEKKTTNMYADGGKQIIFDTGVRKQYFNNGYVIIFFANGDIKQKLPDETILYFYYQKQVDQITLPNKTNIYRFENNQVEFHFQNQRVEIRHPDGTFKIV